MEDVFILHRLKSGDKSGFKDLFDKYFDFLLIIALNYCKIPEDAKDIVQNTFVDFWNNERYNKLTHPQQLKYYLSQSVKNSCLDQIGKEKRLRLKNEKYSTFLISDHTNLLNSPFEKETSKDINNIDTDLLLKKLPPQTYKVVELVFLNNKKQKEAATILGLSPNTIRNQLEGLRKF